LRVAASDLFSGPLAAGGIPAGPFRCILADPPWRFTLRSEKGMGRSPDGLSKAKQKHNAAENHYPTMAPEEILGLPVGQVAADDCILFLWAVDPLLPLALEVGRAWGFTYKTVAFVWAKRRRVTSRRGNALDHPDHKEFPMGTGYWTRANPEICLLFTRGAPKRLSASVRKLVLAARREHSRKPDEIYDHIEQLCAGPRLEMFARHARAGWTSWGNQLATANDRAAAA
jgi:N6-adenosine-specific RNA methylase IME4